MDLDQEIEDEIKKLHVVPSYDELKSFAKYFVDCGHKLCLGELAEDAITCKVQVNGTNERYLALNNPVVPDNTLEEGEEVLLAILKPNQVRKGAILVPLEVIPKGMSVEEFVRGWRNQDSQILRIIDCKCRKV